MLSVSPFLLLFSTLLLSSCALLSFSNPSPLSPPPSNFLVEGRLALSDGERGFSLRFSWQRLQHRGDHWSMITPAGTPIAELIQPIDSDPIWRIGNEWYADLSSIPLLTPFESPSLPLAAIASILWGYYPADAEFTSSNDAASWSGWNIRWQQREPITGWPRVIFLEHPPFRLTFLIDRREAL